MKIEMIIHKKDFPKVEMALFGYNNFEEDTQIELYFKDSDERYSYHTERIKDSYLLVTGV